MNWQNFVSSNLFYYNAYISFTFRYLLYFLCNLCNSMYILGASFYHNRVIHVLPITKHLEIDPSLERSLALSPKRVWKIYSYACYQISRIKYALQSFTSRSCKSNARFMRVEETYNINAQALRLETYIRWHRHDPCIFYKYTLLAQFAIASRLITSLLRVLNWIGFRHFLAYPFLYGVIKKPVLLSPVL